MIKFLLKFEIPIKEGYIWIEIDENNEIISSPIAMCIEDEEKEIVCNASGDMISCINCEYHLPEMIRRWENINKTYDQMKNFLENLAIETKNKTFKKLYEIESRERKKMEKIEKLNKPLPEILPESCQRCDYFDHTYQLEPYCELKECGVSNYLDEPPSWCPLRD
jgi:hypothetical protein